MTSMNEKPHRTRMDEFRSTLADYKSIGPWALGGTVFVPLADYAIRLGPPWPDGLAIITSIVELLVVLTVFHFWYRSSYKRASRRMLLAIALLVGCFGVYLYLNSLFTFTAGANAAKYIKGYAVRPDVAPLITADFTVDDALASSEYNAEAVWTKGSIAVMRIILLFLWLISFALLSMTISSFVIYHRRKRARSIGNGT
jgi:hypothetical protein